MGKEVLHISNLYAGDPKYGYLTDFSLYLCSGELVNIVGTVTSGLAAFSEFIQGNLPIERGRFRFCGLEATTGKCIEYNKKILCLNEKSLLIDNRTAVENIIILAQVNKPGVFISNKKSRERALQLLNEFSLEINIDAKVEELSLFQKHALSIVKAVEQEVAIIYIDNCFKHYGHLEVEQMCNLLQLVKKRKVAVIWSSLKYDKNMNIADRILAMNSGKIVKQFYQIDFQEMELNRYLYGENYKYSFTHKNRIRNEISIVLENVSIGCISGVSLTARKGEIIGLYQTENVYNTMLAKAIVGEIKMDNGKIFLDNKIYVPKDMKRAILNHIGYLPENMLYTSVFKNMNIFDNISLLILKNNRKFGIFTDKAATRTFSKEILGNKRLVDSFVTTSIEKIPLAMLVEVLLSKWLLFRPKIFVCMDISSFAEKNMKTLIYETLDEMAEAGTTIFLSSSRLSDLKSICDTIYIVEEKGIETQK